jgi:hypothetical protein
LLATFQNSFHVLSSHDRKRWPALLFRGSQKTKCLSSSGGSGAADTLNTAPIGADTSQQTLLTTPQHS